MAVGLRDRTTSLAYRHWLPPLLGAVAGVAYSAAEFLLDQPSVQVPSALRVTHDLFDLTIPLTLGVLVGLGYNLFRRQVRFNRSLSTENAELQRHVLANTLISHVLHEIRNPIHNLLAALDDRASDRGVEDDQIVQRNLQRLSDLVTQYSRWSALSEEIDPAEPVALRPWLQAFVEDKLHPRLRQLNIHYEQQVAPVRVALHPLLLEQACVTVFGNACEVLERTTGPRHLLVSASLPAAAGERVALRISNTGSQFPAEVLAAQGHSPVTSQRGLGVGLLLVRKLLEQVGGELVLANRDGRAEVTLLIPSFFVGGGAA